MPLIIFHKETVLFEAKTFTEHFWIYLICGYEVHIGLFPGYSSAAVPDIAGYSGLTIIHMPY